MLSKHGQNVEVNKEEIKDDFCDTERKERKRDLKFTQKQKNWWNLAKNLDKKSN